MDIGSFPHQVTRLVFDTGQPYDEFRARYEAAVPALDEKRLAGFAARGAAWPDSPRTPTPRHRTASSSSGASTPRR
jgi:hypothetical protein